MFNKRRFFIIIFLSWMMLTHTSWGQSRSGYGSPFASYQSAEGFTITSYSKNWNTPSKLKEISKELLSNTYGKEISYLNNIYLYPDSPDGVLAYTHYDLKRNKSGNYYYGNNTYIELFDVKEYKNVQDMAWVLAHEYGHHFTIYHLLNKENKFFDQWRQTGYAKVRNISTHPKISYQEAYEGTSHLWDVMEIAAEDYVQLFGSSVARRSIIYRDIQQRAYENLSNDFNYVGGFNLQPQENPYIPLAADVEGLKAYWQKLAGLPITANNPPSLIPSIRLVSKKAVMPGHYQYRFEWDEIPNAGNYEYTLIAYPDIGHIIPTPIKTVKSGQSMHAFVGSTIKTVPKTGEQKLMIDEYSGRYQFNLLIKDSDNNIYRGNPLQVNFHYPVISNNSLYKDMHQSDWSYDAIEKLADLKIMVGSPDQYFYPLKKVTYTELITLIDRCIAWDPNMSGGSFTTQLLRNKQIKQKELDALNDLGKISRDDVAYLIYHYMILKDSPKDTIEAVTPFKDDKNIKRKKEVNYLYEKGIVKGINGYYFPNNELSRQELASLITRLLNK